jgi:putative N6-adenine-specific DNA methylase
MAKIFLVVPPGIEEITIKEIQLLPPDQFPSMKDVSQLEFNCSLEEMVKLNLALRTPNRILIRMAVFHSTQFADLVKKTRKLEWENYLDPNSNIQIRTTCRKSKLYHSAAVSQRIHNAIELRLGRSVQLVKGELIGEQPSNLQLIIVRIVDDEVTISIDSSGNPLHQRGYRKASGKAPLRENLAAAMLLASGWLPQFPLIDPFCGSGTIPIEAALISSNKLPGLARNFAFENWPAAKNINFQLLKNQFTSQIRVVQKNICGSDRDEGAVRISSENSKRAGFEDQILWSHQAVSAIIPDRANGWIITNPPYGQRISSNKDLRNLYAQFGNILRGSFIGWKVVFLCSDQSLANQTRLNPSPLISFANGGIQVTAYSVEV